MNEFHITGKVESIIPQNSDDKQVMLGEVCIKCKSPLYDGEARIIVHYYKKLDSKIEKGQQVHVKGYIAPGSFFSFPMATEIKTIITTIENK